MPFTTEHIEPELLLIFKDVRIYHCYKNDNFDSRFEYWYSTDILERFDYEFDVRELPVPEETDEKDHSAIVISN